MTRWLEIAFTLIGFTTAMAVVGWVVRATVPPFGDWLWDRIGGGAAWALLIAVVLAAAVYAYLGHRKGGTNPNGM